jgi:hypothetical protein
LPLFRADLGGDRHDNAKLPPFDQAGDHASDDAIRLDEPSLLAFEALEGMVQSSRITSHPSASSIPSVSCSGLFWNPTTSVKALLGRTTHAPLPALAQS